MMDYPGMTAHIIVLGSVTKEKLAPLLELHITSPKKTAVGAGKVYQPKCLIRGFGNTCIDLYPVFRL